MKLLDRFKAATPVLWNWIKTISLSTKVVCLAILELYREGYPIPAQLTTYAGWTLGACVAITIYAQGQVKKPEDATKG